MLILCLHGLRTSVKSIWHNTTTMEKEIYYKGYKISSYSELINKYGINEFKSPYRSTIPLLAYFITDKWNYLNLIESSKELIVKCIFEHKTPVKYGKGSPSCTDLMIETKDECISIEAKRTEPPYIKVKKWIGDSNNRELVLDGWLETICDYINIEINKEEVYELPYQIVHRVAAACSMQKVKAHVAYIGFDITKTRMNYYFSCIDLFNKILKNKIDFHLFNFQIIKSDEQKELELLWDSGNRNLSERVKVGLKNEILMDFIG